MLCRFSVEVTHFVTCFMQFYWAETVMFIKIWQAITLYIDRMDWGAGHLTTTEGTGVEHLPTKIVRKAGHLNNFFKCPGYARGFGLGGCSRLELTHTLLSDHFHLTTVRHHATTWPVISTIGYNHHTATITLLQYHHHHHHHCVLLDVVIECSYAGSVIMIVAVIMLTA